MYDNYPVVDLTGSAGFMFAERESVIQIQHISDTGIRCAHANFIRFSQRYVINCARGSIKRFPKKGVAELERIRVWVSGWARKNCINKIHIICLRFMDTVTILNGTRVFYREL